MGKDHLPAAINEFLLDQYTKEAASWLIEILEFDFNAIGESDDRETTTLCTLLAKRLPVNLISDALLAAFFAHSNLLSFVGPYAQVLNRLEDFQERDLTAIMEYFCRYGNSFFFQKIRNNFLLFQRVNSTQLILRYTHVRDMNDVFCLTGRRPRHAAKKPDSIFDRFRRTLSLMGL